MMNTHPTNKIRDDFTTIPQIKLNKNYKKKKWCVLTPTTSDHLTLENQLLK